MRVNSITIKCDNCDYTGTYKYYNDVIIEPKDGCYISDIKYKYCMSCQTYTKCFMGKVKEGIISGYWDYPSEERKEINEYYKKIGSIPKCIECGSTHLEENPKHSCGGNIYVDIDEDGLIFSLGDRTKWVYEYDDLGNVTKREIIW